MIWDRMEAMGPAAEATTLCQGVLFKGVTLMQAQAASSVLMIVSLLRNRFHLNPQPHVHLEAPVLACAQAELVAVEAA